MLPGGGRHRSGRAAGRRAGAGRHCACPAAAAAAPPPGEEGLTGCEPGRWGLTECEPGHGVFSAASRQSGKLSPVVPPPGWNGSAGCRPPHPAAGAALPAPLLREKRDGDRQQRPRAAPSARLCVPGYTA